MAFLEKCVPQICSKFRGGDSYGNVISIELRSTSAWVLYVNLLRICRTPF